MFLEDPKDFPKKKKKKSDIMIVKDTKISQKRKSKNDWIYKQKKKKREKMLKYNYKIIKL